MSSWSHEQRRIVHRGRTFLFVSYGAEEPARKTPGRPATWFLVSSNNRWPAIPFVPNQAGEEVDALCVAWLEEAVFAPVPPVTVAPVVMEQRFLRPGNDVAPA